jgi:serine/threonine protein kinase
VLGTAAAVVGPYRLDERIGRGAGSEVWRARHVDGRGDPVALKRGRGQSSAEAAVLARLDHPGVVRLLDVVPDGDGVALVTELAAGGSLDELLVRRARLRPGEVVALLAPVADALEHAHGRSIVHGDLKPANVLLTATGRPLLTDFGAGAGARGTAPFVDPRVAAGGRVDPPADVYSLAVVAYVSLTGRLPHTGPTEEELLAAARRAVHRPLTDEPGVPAALAAAIETALAVDPGARPSAGGFAAALRSAVPATEVVLPGVAVPVAGPGPVLGGDTRDFGPRPVRPDAAPVARRRPWRGGSAGRRRAPPRRRGSPP